jgi:phage shock protein C
MAALGWLWPKAALSDLRNLWIGRSRNPAVRPGLCRGLGEHMIGLYGEGAAAAVLGNRSMAHVPQKLCRARDRMIAGVCGGVAEYFGWPARRLRIVYLLVSLLSAAFPGTVVYCILWFLMSAPSRTAPTGIIDV